MTYFEGFIVPGPEGEQGRVPEARRPPSHRWSQKIGVGRMVESWDNDVPEGKLTDFRKAVDATPDEKIVFSWFEYPSRQARDAANEKFMSDPQMEEMGKDMPFDGKRMVMGGFDAIVEEGSGGGSYTDGIVVPVPRGKRDAYRELAARTQKFPRKWRHPGRRDLRRRRSARQSHGLLSSGEGRGRRDASPSPSSNGPTRRRAIRRWQKIMAGRPDAAWRHAVRRQAHVLGRLREDRRHRAAASATAAPRPSPPDAR